MKGLSLSIQILNKRKNKRKQQYRFMGMMQFLLVTLELRGYKRTYKQTQETQFNGLFLHISYSYIKYN